MNGGCPRRCSEPTNATTSGDGGAPRSRALVELRQRLYGSQIAQVTAMAMSPVRRAFVILLVTAAVVALLLMLAQDQETLKIRSAVGVEDPRHSAYVSALVGTALSRGNRYDVLTNGD